MVEIAVCDDETRFAVLIEKLLEKIAKKNRVKINIEVFTDGFDIVREIKKGYCFDIIYMDIEMKGKNGLEAAKEIREIDKVALLIYVSNYESYMAETFDYRPFQFLVKPINEVVFEKYFLKAYTEITKNEQYFHYKYKKIYYKVLIQKIIYFESDKRVIFMKCEENLDTVRKFYEKLDNIEKFMENSDMYFLRIHQSFLVNYKYIEEMFYDKIILLNGETLYISEDRRKAISNQYCSIIGSKNKWI